MAQTVALTRVERRKPDQAAAKSPTLLLVNWERDEVQYGFDECWVSGGCWGLAGCFGLDRLDGAGLTGPSSSESKGSSDDRRSLLLSAFTLSPSGVDDGCFPAGPKLPEAGDSLGQRSPVRRKNVDRYLDSRPGRSVVANAMNVNNVATNALRIVKVGCRSIAPGGSTDWANIAKKCNAQIETEP